MVLRSGTTTSECSTNSRSAPETLAVPQRPLHGGQRDIQSSPSLSLMLTEHASACLSSGAVSAAHAAWTQSAIRCRDGDSCAGGFDGDPRCFRDAPQPPVRNAFHGRETRSVENIQLTYADYRALSQSPYEVFFFPSRIGVFTKSTRGGKQLHFKRLRQECAQNMGHYLGYGKTCILLCKLTQKGGCSRTTGNRPIMSVL